MADYKFEDVLDSLGFELQWWMEQKPAIHLHDLFRLKQAIELDIFNIEHEDD